MEAKVRTTKMLKIIDINSHPIIGIFKHVKSKSSIESDITKLVYPKQRSIFSSRLMTNKNRLLLTPLDVKPASIKSGFEPKKIKKCRSHKLIPSKIVIKVPVVKRLPSHKLSFLNRVNYSFESDHATPIKHNIIITRKNNQSFNIN